MHEGDGLVDVWHVTSDGLHLAFWYLAPRLGDVIEAARVKLLDGGRPFTGDLVLCGTCGESVAVEDLEPSRWAD